MEDTKLYKTCLNQGCKKRLMDIYYRVYPFSVTPYLHPAWLSDYDCGEVSNDSGIRLCIDCARRIGLLW